MFQLVPLFFRPILSTAANVMRFSGNQKEALRIPPVYNEVIIKECSFSSINTADGNGSVLFYCNSQECTFLIHQTVFSETKCTNTMSQGGAFSIFARILTLYRTCFIKCFAGYCSCGFFSGNHSLVNHSTITLCPETTMTSSFTCIAVEGKSNKFSHVNFSKNMYQCLWAVGTSSAIIEAVGGKTFLLSFGNFFENTNSYILYVEQSLDDYDILVSTVNIRNISMPLGILFFHPCFVMKDISIMESSFGFIVLQDPAYDSYIFNLYVDFPITMNGHNLHISSSALTAKTLFYVDLYSNMCDFPSYVPNITAFVFIGVIVITIIVLFLVFYFKSDSIDISSVNPNSMFSKLSDDEDRIDFVD